MDYKSNNKGFTLVELLAVIVILAVVILIAVTAVIPRMNNAKKKAFIDESLIYLKAGKEAYTTDQNTECYNINEFDNYIKNNKDNYSGTLFVNEKGTTLNLTDGKYYVITSGDLSAHDIKESSPKNFITSCADTSKSFTISYDLDGGTLSEANPTSYNYNTPTFTLNNPTKSGYRFVGWSSKNLFNMYGRTEDSFSEFTSNTRQFDLNKYYVGMATNSRYRREYISSLSISHVWTIECAGVGYGVGFPMSVKPSTTYRIVNPSGGDIGVAYYAENGQYLTFIQPQSTDFSFTTTSTTRIANIVLKPGVANTGINYYDIQIEQGSTSTDYQEYMEPTISAKVYRGSVGNKKFIANWEAV